MRAAAFLSASASSAAAGEPVVENTATAVKEGFVRPHGFKFQLTVNASTWKARRWLLLVCASAVRTSVCLHSGSLLSKVACELRKGGVKLRNSTVLKERRLHTTSLKPHVTLQRH